MPEKIAEVIASSTTQFVAEVYRDAVPPPFGTWVRVDQPDGTTLFALISHIEIVSLAPNRRAVALGLTPDELRAEYPQIPELLRTTLRALVLAFTDARGRLRQTLPPQPPGIHAFVHTCTPEHVCSLGAPFDFLRTLVQNPDPGVPVDDLLVAVLSNLYEAQGGPPDGEDALVEAGRVLSRLLRDDHERLHSILRRSA